MKRLKGRVFSVNSGGAEIVGYIEVENGEVSWFRGRDLDGYRGESLYKFGLVQGSIVSFEVDKEGDTTKIRIEHRPSNLVLIWRILYSPIFCMSMLFFAALAPFYFKNLLPYVVSFIILLCIGNIGWQAYQEVKKVFE